MRCGAMVGNEYFSVTEFAELHKIDVSRVRRLIYEERIPAIKIGNQWAIPANTPKPSDKRVKSSKYKDWRKKKQ